MDIVAVNYNSTIWMLRCLESFHSEIKTIPLKVFVQDNSSCDGIDCITEPFPEVRVRKNKKNIGFARAVNEALKTSSSEYVVLLNPDTIVMDGFFAAALVKKAESV